MSLKAFLTRLIRLCVLPLLLLMFFFVGNHIYTLHSLRDQEIQDHLHNIATAFDRKLEARIAALQMLAASSLADDRARLKEFYAEAQNFRESFGGHIILADLSMQMIFNTRVELGTSLPKLPRPKGHAAAPTVLETGRPAVGDMFLGPIAKEMLVAVATPVIRNGRVESLVLNIVETARFQERLDEMSLPFNSHLKLLDGKDEIMASRIPPNAAKNRAAPEKEPARKYVLKLTNAPWTMVLAIPHDLYYAPIMRAALALLAAILVVTLTGIMAARSAGHRLGRAVMTLTAKPRPEELYPLIDELEAVRSILDEEAATRRRAEQDLRENEQRYHQLFESSPDALFVLDADGRFLDVNIVAEQRYGYSREELLHMSVPDLAAADQRPQAEHRVKQALAAGARFEWVHRRKDGSELPVEISARPIILLGGQRCALSSVRDITERKRAEQEIIRTNQELLAINRIITTTTTTTGVQRILEKVLDEALAATGLEGGTICMVTPDERLHLAAHRGTSEATIEDLTTNIIKVGDCLCGESARDQKPLILPDREAVLGFSTRESTRGEEICFHAAFPLLANEKCLGVLCVFTRTDNKPTERSLKLLESISAQVAMAVRNAQLQEETLRHSETLANKVRDRTAELEKTRQALVNLLEDIKEKNAELATANERLQELDRLKSMFIATMSHELRTPLNSVIGFSSILKEEWLGPVNNEQKKNLGYILDSGKHLLSLINDVIDLSKIEAGMLEAEIEDFSLPDLVAEALATVKPTADEKGLTLESDIRSLAVFSDRRRLLQCLLNLLSNAVKFTDSGTITITAAAGSRENENTVKIEVKDTGIGIRPKDMTKLFKPFSRLHSPGSSQYPGTGLGLYLTRKLVQETLKGEISVNSVYGKGSVFSIEVPICPTAEKDRGNH